MNQEGMIKPALIGGVLLGILSALPVISALNCLCCAWVVGGGVLAAHLYVKSSLVPVTLGRGVALGLLTGVIGAVVDLAFTIPLQFMLRGVGINLLGKLGGIVDQLPNMPAESKEALRKLLSHTSGVGVVFLLIGGLFTLLIYGVMGMMGGAIGVAIFEKRKPGAPQSPDYGPPQPPVNIPPLPGTIPPPPEDPPVQ